MSRLPHPRGDLPAVRKPGPSRDGAAVLHFDVEIDVAPERNPHEHSGLSYVQKLIQAIKARRVSTIYAESLDRISRDPGDLMQFRKLLRHYGVDFVSIADGVR